MRDPDIRFFSQANPDHMKGVELVCITELSAANLRSIALRYFMLGWNGGHDHAECGRDFALQRLKTMLSCGISIPAAR